MTLPEQSDSRDPVVGDEIVVLAEIVVARQNGNTDTMAGNGDDDLLAAAESAMPYLDALITQLRGY